MFGQVSNQRRRQLRLDRLHRELCDELRAKIDESDGDWVELSESGAMARRIPGGYQCLRPVVWTYVGGGQSRGVDYRSLYVIDADGNRPRFIVTGVNDMPGHASANDWSDESLIHQLVSPGEVGLFADYVFGDR